MRSAKARRELSRILSPWRFFAVLGGTLVVIFLVAFAGKALQNYQLNEETKALRLEVEELKRQRSQLEGTRAFVQTDAYVEKAAREELHWSKPDEIYLVVVPAPEAQILQTGSLEPTEAAGPTPTEGGEVSHSEALWKKWWALFFDSPPGDLNLMNP